MMNRESKLLRWVLALAAVCILAATFGAYTSGMQALEGHRLLLQQQESIRLIDDLLLSVTELESAGRGYVLTGSEEYAVPYASARQKLGTLSGELAEGASSGRFPQALVSQLSELIEEKTAEVAEGVAARRNSGTAASQVLVASEAERGMQAIRTLAADLRAQQFERMDQGLKTLRQETISSVRMFVIGGILGLLFITWGFHRYRLENEKRMKAAGEAEDLKRLWNVALDNVGDAVLVANGDRKVTFMNREAERLTGWRLPEARDQPLEHVFRAVDDKSREPEAVSAGSGRKTLAGTLVLSRAGAEHPVCGAVAPLRDEDRGAGLVVCFRDTSGERLQDTWTRTILDSTYDAVLVHDADGRVLDFNVKALDLYGVSPKDFEFLTIFDLSAPGMPPHEARLMWARVMSGERLLFQWKALRPFDRKQFDVEVFLNRVQFPGREAIMANIRDITERKRAEQELREREKQLRVISESLPQLVWTATGKKGCDYVSGQWLVYTGAVEGDVLGWGWLNFVHPADTEKARETWLQAVQQGETFTAQFRLLGRDKAYRAFIVRAVPVKDDEGKVLKWFGTCTDIEELEQARQVLAKSRGELEATVEERTAELRQTVAELESFTYSLSHDMRAPLRTMRSFSQILLADYGSRLDEEGREHLARIEKAAGRLDQLIQDMLDYSRVLSEDADLEQVDCDQLVRRIVAERPFLQGSKVVVDIANRLPRVRAHPATLAQCLANILDNAVKFVKAGSACNIVVRCEHLEKHVRLWIEDNGIGIPPDLTERIFGVFQRLHSEEEYPGTGIGLAIVRKAVERMGGHVGVTSEPGKGSRFWLELPSAEEAEHEAEQHSINRR